MFVASARKSPETYEVLKTYHEKLTAMEIDTFFPIYCNPEYEYASIRFMKSDEKRFNSMKPRNVYRVEFSIKQKNKDKKIYVNCYLKSLKLLTKAEKFDEGEELEL